MTTYVIEIDGRAVMAFDAENRIEAEYFGEQEWLKSDLMVLESNDLPLWDGASDLYVREALEDERAKWDSSRASALLDGKDVGESWVAYLVPVSDPTDDEDYNDSGT